MFPSSEDRAAGWGLLTTAVLKFPEISATMRSAAGVANKDGGTNKDGMPPKIPKDRPAPRPRRPQRLIKVVMRRFVE